MPLTMRAIIHAYKTTVTYQWRHSPLSNLFESLGYEENTNVAVIPVA